MKASRSDSVHRNLLVQCQWCMTVICTVKVVSWASETQCRYGNAYGRTGREM